MREKTVAFHSRVCITTNMICMIMSRYNNQILGIKDLRAYSGKLPKEGNIFPFTAVFALHGPNITSLAKSFGAPFTLVHHSPPFSLLSPVIPLYVHDKVHNRCQYPYFIICTEYSYVALKPLAYSSDLFF